MLRLILTSLLIVSFFGLIQNTPKVPRWRGCIKGTQHQLSLQYRLRVRLRKKIKINIFVRQTNALEEIRLHEHVGTTTFSRNLHTYKKEWAAYVSKHYAGTVIIEMNPENGFLFVEGHMTIRGTHYVIKSRTRGGTWRMHSLGNGASIARLKNIRPICSVDKKRFSRQKRANPVYTVNLLVVVDKWLVDVLNDLSGKAPDNDKFSVTEFLHKFYAVIIVSINQYMKTLAQYGLHIQCRGGGLLILQDDIDKNNVLPHHPSRKYADRQTTPAVSTLNVFKSYLSSKNVYYDFAVLLTGRSLVRDHEFHHILGRALDKGSVCTRDAVGIVETRGDNVDTIIIAHELSHGLGALHDGVGINADCKETGIMKAIVEIAELTYPEVFRSYSRCSAKLISESIDKNLTKSNNCLLRRNIESLPKDPYLGATMSLERQCFHHFHTTKYKKTLFPCHHVTCIRGSKQKMIIPFNGTPCEIVTNRKNKPPGWCVEGYCKEKDLQGIW